MQDVVHHNMRDIRKNQWAHLRADARAALRPGSRDHVLNCAALTDQAVLMNLEIYAVGL